MNGDEFLELMRSHDHPRRLETPPGGVCGGTSEFQAELQKMLGAEVKIAADDQIQDASFHQQIAIGDACLRFSSFGKMVAFVDEEEVDHRLKLTIDALLRAHGFTLIPRKFLDQPCTGKAKGFRGSNVFKSWWDRFFEYIG